MELWKMPGPSGLLSIVESDLREGRSVLLATPKGARVDLRAAVKRIVNRRELGEWKEASITGDNRAHPLRVVATGIDPASHQEVASVRELADAHKGYVVWIDGVEPDVLPTWGGFLSDFNHVSRANSLFNRSMLVVTCSGVDERQLPPTDVALAIRPWRNVVGESDLMLQLSARISAVDHPALHRALRRALIRELARFDLHLAETMVKWALSSLIEPIDGLRQYAAQRGWSKEVCRSPSWHLGLLDTFEQEEIEHVCVKVMCGDLTTVQRRVWRAQVSTLFPAMEEERVRFIDDHKGKLSRAINSNDRTRLLDLEFGDLQRYVVDQTGFDRRTREKVTLLRDMRNSLAHLEPVSYERLKRVSEVSALPGLGKLP